ncbi:MAG TPA: YciI family protein, partial [Nitrospira sp.]|nr:YciI family protein [Nitrospira sp.]
MKYMCLVYVEEAILNAMPKKERQSLSDESMAYCNNLMRMGQCLAASPLHPVETAATVRVRNGKAATTDGPFAETKEQLGGFFLLSMRDL